MENTPTLRECKQCRSPIDFVNPEVLFCGPECKKLHGRAVNPSASLRDSGVPERYLRCSFENLEGGALIKSRLERFPVDVPFVFITGTVGSGKTHCAVSLMRHILTTTFLDAMFVTSTSLFMDLRATFDKGTETEERVMSRCLKRHLFVIDDLGAEKPSEYVRQSWYTIIDGRYSRVLPTVITSNLMLDEVSTIYGDRIASRISSGIVLKFSGEDYRLKLRREAGI